MWLTVHGSSSGAPGSLVDVRLIAVGVKPDEIAVGADHVFIGNVGSRSISVIDPASPT